MTTQISNQIDAAEISGLYFFNQLCILLKDDRRWRMNVQVAYKDRLTTVQTVRRRCAIGLHDEKQSKDANTVHRCRSICCTRAPTSLTLFDPAYLHFR